MTSPEYGQQPYQPPYQQAPPSTGRHSRLLLGVVVLALVATGIVWLVRSAGRTADFGRVPFDGAVANLADAPALHYRGSLVGSALAWDVRVTSHDEAVGTITAAGEEFGVLRVAGRSYLRPPAGLLPDSTSSVPANLLKGKWVTGNDIIGNGVLGPVLAQFSTPAELAAKLHSALAAVTSFPAADAGGTTVIDGAAAARVSTPLGDLYVASNQPYRVLRLTPQQSLSSGRLLGEPRPTTRTRPTAHGADFPLRQQDSSLGSTDFPQLSDDDVDALYNDLRGDTTQLSTAVDEDIQFTLDGQADLQCGDGGCEVTAHVNADVTAGANATVTASTITAELTATVLIEGEPAGGCTATGSLPSRGTGSISCADGAAGAVFAAVESEKKTQAEAQSEAQGGVAVPYTIEGTGEAYVNATAEVNVAQDVQDEQDQQDQLPWRDDTCHNSFVGATRVLRPDGTGTAIGSVGVGSRVADSAPGEPALASHLVAAREVTDADRNFADVTVSTASGLVTVTSTADHEFYDRSEHAWVGAANLRPGDRLQSVGAGRAVVVAVRAYRAAYRTYDLTVDGLHTFYVLAGTTPVLVHNACAEEQSDSADSFSAARVKAKDKAQLGEDSKPYLSEVGPLKGRVYVGQQSADGRSGWRIDWDCKNPEKGFHLNWWRDWDFSLKRSVQTGQRGYVTVNGAKYNDYLNILEHFPKN